MFILQDMPETGTYSLQADINTPPYAPQYAVTGKEAGKSKSGLKPAQSIPPVATNVSKRKFQSTLGFSNTQVRVLEEDIHDTTDKLICQNLSEIIYWCQ